MKTKFYISFAVILLLSTLATTCNKPTKVSSVSISSSQLILYMNETATLIATIHPIDADNKTVIWTSSNNTVATVDEDGRVTAIKQGTASITVTTEEGNHRATCKVEVLHPLEPELVFVEGGTFTMGCTDGECADDGRDLPTHKVTLSSFKIAKYLVTREQWCSIMYDSAVIVYDGKAPVNVHTNDLEEDVVLKFIHKLNEITGKNYRLPTEAEWEYAARGGNKSKGYIFSGSNIFDDIGWCAVNIESFPDPDHRIPVGVKAPNELGIYDMSGLAFEMCSDGYGSYTNEWQTNPQYPAAASYVRVLRGGSINTFPFDCKVSARDCCYHSVMTAYISFRLVLP